MKLPEATSEEQMCERLGVSDAVIDFVRRNRLTLRELREIVRNRNQEAAGASATQGDPTQLRDKTAGSPTRQTSTSGERLESITSRDPETTSGQDQQRADESDGRRLNKPPATPAGRGCGSRSGDGASREKAVVRSTETQPKGGEPREPPAHLSLFAPSRKFCRGFAPSLIFCRAKDWRGGSWSGGSTIGEAATTRVGVSRRRDLIQI